MTAVVLGVLASPAAAFAADTTAPTVPTNLRVTASTATSVTLAWNASSDESGTFYYVLEDNFGYFTYPWQSQTSATLTGLLPARTYVYRIRAFDAAQNISAWSNSVSHTTPPDVTAPSAPVLSLTYLAPARMAVRWTKSVDNTSLLLFYTLLVNGAPRTGDITGGLAQTLLGLTPATAYSLQVSVRDPYGNTAFSNTLNVTTPVQTDFAPPTAPGNLRGRADSGGCEVYLSWNQSTDNVDAQSAILYRFRVNGQLSPPRSFVIGRGTNVGVTVLEGTLVGPNTFTVEAVDGSGNVSALSNTFTLNVDPC